MGKLIRKTILLGLKMDKCKKQNCEKKRNENETRKEPDSI